MAHDRQAAAVQAAAAIRDYIAHPRLCMCPERELGRGGRESVFVRISVGTDG